MQAKMSQKERKRQQILQAEANSAVDKDKAKAMAWENVKSAARPPPWKAASPAAKTSVKDGMQSETALLAVEGNPRVVKRRAASPDTRFSGQGRANSAPLVPTAGSSKSQEQKPLVPHSKSYMKPAPKAEAIIGSSMADIIGQQQMEQQRVKEAVAKKSLQEIQEEQAFQEWWDQESRRTQEEEARRRARGGKDGDHVGGGNRRGGGRKGRGGKSKPGSVEKTGDTTKQAAGNPATCSRGRGGKN